MTKLHLLTYIQKHALLNRVESVTSEEERLELKKASNKQHLAATLLPIRSVGVQVSVSKNEFCSMFVLDVRVIIAIGQHYIFL